MFDFLLRALQGERGVTVKFLATLFVVVAAIFTFLSGTSCNEPSTSTGCGNNSNPNPPVNMDGSQGVSMTTVGNTPFQAYMGGSTGPFAPGSNVNRTLGYSGSGVTRIVWTPPPGASSFNFVGAPAPQPGGPPYVFLDPPNSFTVSYNLPGLPTGTNSQSVSESMSCEAADGSSNNTSLVNTIQRPGSFAAALEASFIAPQAPDVTQAISVPVYIVDQWRSVPGQVLTTTECQSLYDWLQSDEVFGAMRVPVSVTEPYASFPAPIIFGPDEDTRPVLKFTNDYTPVSGMPDVPLELRPERMTYLENHLPAAAGEHWLALGVAAEPKMTCPQGLNAAAWELQFSFPIALVGKATNLPIYYCYEGEDPPPIANVAAKVMAGADASATQDEGITCLGPQDQSLDPDPNPDLHIGNPGVAWDITPPKNISFKHYLTEKTLAPVNLSATTNLPASSWILYQGDDNAPDLAQPITNPWTLSNTFEFFWLVGDVPQSALPGSYSITITAVTASEPFTSTYVNDLLWVGEWTPPPSEETSYSIFLPLAKK